MRSRSIQFLFMLMVASMLVGCNDSDNRQVVPPETKPAAPALHPTGAPHVQIQPLTADQLAQILGVNVWTARYSGRPIECWLEIEEEGQSTLPKRIPEKDFLGAGSANPPSEGTIDLWWSRREDRQGGQLTIHAANGSYTYGLAKDAFTFAWQGVGASHTTIGKGEPIQGEPGKAFVIVEYDARELHPDSEKKSTRRVHLKLMGRFPMQM
jgi:hypothetical protein